MQLAGIEFDERHDVALLAVTFLTAIATYLLDRVKLHDAWLDPADRDAHPARFEFLARRSRSVRLLIVAAVAGAVALGATMSRLMAAMPIASCVGVLLYAARPRGSSPRPKDVIVLKNVYVAGGIAAFAVVITFAAAAALGGAVAATTAVFLVAYLGIRVFADAALCDLDDEQADRRHGTRTLPTRLGRRSAWNIALALRTVSAVALALVPVGPPLARAAWAVVTVASSTSLRIASPTRVRDWVDLRFAFEAVAATLLQVGARQLTG